MMPVHFVIRVALVGAVASMSLLIPAPAAQAEEPAFEDRLGPSAISAFQNPSAELVTGLAVRLATVNGDLPVAGTVVTFTATSCGNLLQSATRTLAGPDDNQAGVAFSPDGEFDPSENPVSRLVGPSIEYRLTITQPGYDTFSDDYSYGGYSVKRPTCQEINSPLTPSWSRRKKASPISGRKLSVTPTTAPDATVTYTWKARNRFGNVMGKTLGTGRSIRLKNDWVGRRLGVIVRVIRAGYQPQSKTIVFAQVRKRAGV